MLMADRDFKPGLPAQAARCTARLPRLRRPPRPSLLTALWQGAVVAVALVLCLAACAAHFGSASLCGLGRRLRGCCRVAVPAILLRIQHAATRGTLRAAIEPRQDRGFSSIAAGDSSIAALWLVASAFALGRARIPLAAPAQVVEDRALRYKPRRAFVRCLALAVCRRRAASRFARRASLTAPA